MLAVITMGRMFLHWGILGVSLDPWTEDVRDD
jgi:hypothetical protein